MSDTTPVPFTESDHRRPSISLSHSSSLTTSLTSSPIKTTTTATLSPVPKPEVISVQFSEDLSEAGPATVEVITQAEINEQSPTEAISFDEYSGSRQESKEEESEPRQESDNKEPEAEIEEEEIENDDPLISLEDRPETTNPLDEAKIESSSKNISGELIGQLIEYSSDHQESRPESRKSSTQNPESDLTLSIPIPEVHLFSRPPSRNLPPEISSFRHQTLEQALSSPPTLTPTPASILVRPKSKSQLTQPSKVTFSSSPQATSGSRSRNTLKMPKFKNNKLEPLPNEIPNESSQQVLVHQKSPSNFRKNNKKLKKAQRKPSNGQQTGHLSNHQQVIEYRPEGENQLPHVNGGLVTSVNASQMPVVTIDPEKFKKGAKIIFAVPQGSGKPAIPIACEVKPSPRTDSVFKQFGDSGFEVFWQNLVYFHLSKKVEKRNKNDVKRLAAEEFAAQQLKQRRKSQVRRYSKLEKEARLLYLTRPTLNNITGSFKSNQMTAIMGPSGAGKTVFLNVITARLALSARKENSGDILINGTKQVRIGFVEQFDQLLPHLTIRETLLYSSKIKNAARYYLNHDKIVANVIARLDLYDCKDVYAGKCSNGQRKRLSIGIELCFNSDILILDEPTTGLDAVTSFGIMSILKNLTKRRKAIAILATIHQPSVKLFNLFDNLLILSKEGTIIYEGSPDKLASTLSLVGLQCPPYTNISDFLLEVASGDFGRQSLHQLAHYNKEYNRSRISGEDLNEVEMHSLQEAVKKGDTVDKRAFLLCTWLLFLRTMLCNLRNPFNTKIRFAAVVTAGTFLGLLFTSEVGKVSTCPPSKYFLWTLQMDEILSEVERQQMKVQENIASIFMIALVALFNSLLNLVVTFPIEVAVFRREYNNYSYVMFSYFLAKLFGDMPFTMTSTILYSAIIYQMTGQIFDTWMRPLMLLVPVCTSTLIGQFYGMIIGVIFADNITASVYSVMFIIIPIIMFAGFFRLLVDMEWFMQRLSWISPLKHIINSMMIVTYGMDRCEHELEYERQAFSLRNVTEEEVRPRWISSLTTLVGYQLQMSAEPNEQMINMFKNTSIDPEVKLVGFMGLNSDLRNGDATKALILRHFNLGNTVADYWKEIQALSVYVLVYAVILYLCMFFRYRARK